MFSFDENGNVLIDADQSDAISRASANRTLSARARALTTGQYVPVAPIGSTVLNPFLNSLGERYKAICANLRGGATRVPFPRGPGDLSSIGIRAIGDWVATELQGFEGPLPILEMDGVNTLDYLLPADGAVIRYLGRLLRKSNGLISVEIVINGDGRPSGVRTLDASDAVNTGSNHTMRIRAVTKYSANTSGRFDAPTVDALKALLKVMDIEEELPAFIRVLRTLSRKLHSTTGNWGEEPRFPIVNFRQKISSYMSGNRVPVTTVDALFHGNSAAMYSDKSVYSVIEPAQKAALIASQPVTHGATPWTTPQA